MRLDEAGLLAIAQRGKRGPEGDRRATSYRLPTEAALDAYQCRETRPLGPSPLVSRPQPAGVSGPSPLVSRPQPLDEAEALVATLRAADPDVLAAALARVGRRDGVRFAAQFVVVRPTA